MTPEEIFAERDAQPPLMRQAAAAVCLGQEVCWSLTYSNASELENGTAHLLFRFDPDGVRRVTGDIKLSSYPSMADLRSGESVLVRGRIRKIDDFAIAIEVDDLVLPRTVESGG